MKRFLGRLFTRKAQKSPEEVSLIQEKQDMIAGIEELSHKTVKEIMVPRIDVASMAESLSEEAVMHLLGESTHSRFPVYRETIDKVVGILYVKDLIRYLYKRKQSFDLKTIIRKAYFVPESMKLDALLREMKKRKVHIAVVVDEYGGVSGIACLEDILEEIIGDIQDEFDNERDDIVRLSDNIYLCDARASIADINQELEIELPSEGFDTLGGFVFDLFGKIPVRYEKVSWDDFDFIIQDMESHKIKAVKIVRRDTESEEANT